jgi:hypothetical protein
MDAKSGGKNHGLYIRLHEQTEQQLCKSIHSYIKNVTDHEVKIKNPSAYISDWQNRSEAYKQGIIKKWQMDIQRNLEQLTIAQYVADERKIIYE